MTSGIFALAREHLLGYWCLRCSKELRRPYLQRSSIEGCHAEIPVFVKNLLNGSDLIAAYWLSHKDIGPLGLAAHPLPRKLQN